MLKKGGSYGIYENDIRKYEMKKNEFIFESNDSVTIADKQKLQIYTDDRLDHSKFRLFWQFSAFIDKFGEARGVERQLPENRHTANFWSYLKLAGIWIGGSCSIPSMTGFFLGSTAYNLGFGPAVTSSVLGSFAGSLIAAFGATMGPRSGLRSMMGLRYQFGWWFAKFLVILNCCTGLGWLIVNGNFGGQLLQALNAHISIRVGIIILFIMNLILSVFGIKVLALFDLFFSVPLMIAFLLCYVCSAGQFVVDKPSKVSGINFNAAWITNFQNCIGITSTWMPVASDYHLDMPVGTNKLVVFFFVLIVIFIPTAFVGILGCGLASSALYDQKKLEIYTTLGGAGLIVDAMDKWGNGGKFLVVLMYISLITNGCLTIYSFGLSTQALGLPIARFPRYILVVVGSVIWFVLAMVGESGWAAVIANFLPMIGYWTLIYGAIMIIETLWFRRKHENEYRWDEYLNSDHFPVMYAAIFAFGCGVAGVILGMNQYYYVGRLANVVGKGSELGSFLCFGFASVAYIPLRYLELYYRNFIYAP